MKTAASYVVCQRYSFIILLKHDLFKPFIHSSHRFRKPCQNSKISGITSFIFVKNEEAKPLP
jgi:hypothetical protein